MRHYDYIFAGAGCAGLSLLTRMIASGKFGDKKILLADKAPKTKNDRTWCFWETLPGFFEPIVHKKWRKLQFHSPHCSLPLDIVPYTYKMIRGIDFYGHCFEQLKGTGTDIQYGDISAIQSHDEYAEVTINGERYTSEFVFNSIGQPFPQQTGKHYLLQHFKGWLIETDTPCFDPAVATLMDFRVTQQYGDCFIYVLPLSAKKAMVECTFFSRELQPQNIYDHLLSIYLLSHIPGVHYRVVEEEYGIIPMTNHRFKKSEGRIINIGTAGGNTKPSSGYTFQFIQKQSAQIVDALMATGQPYVGDEQSRRFHLYDTVLLNVLNARQPGASRIFEDLFRKNDPRMVLRFLDNKSSYLEELKIISSLPVRPFLTAALREMNIFRKHPASTTHRIYANS